MTKKVAVFPGSFDPLTLGHVSMIRRGLAIFDAVVIAVAINIHKSPLFSLDERMDMVRKAFQDETRVTVEGLDGLLARYAQQRGACAILRGLRGPGDFEYELQMSHMNRHLNPTLETVFLSAEAAGSYISSSLVKEVASLGGDVDELVPRHVAKALSERFPTP